MTKIKDGNARYVADQQTCSGTSEYRKPLVDGQKPHTIIVSCADSRVAPEMVFDANIGEVFVIRVAGNIANTSSLASIEYAAAHIGCNLIVVMGHQSCGAVTAALAGGTNGPNLDHLCAHIAPAIANSESKEVNDVVKQNAIDNAARVSEMSKIIRDIQSERDIKIAPAYYSLETGAVEFL